MKKIIILLVIILLAITAVLFSIEKTRKNSSPPLIPSTPTGSANQKSPISAIAPPIDNQSANQPSATSTSPQSQNNSGFQPPLDRAKERVTKKPFGIYITPQNSPLQTEKFRGYHTGTDFEIFPEELNIDVPVKAICSGKIAVKKFASGYGGVLIQNCTLDNQPITVIYGHLKLTSIAKQAGDDLNIGDKIGILGKAYSSETDGERKHLHLGIHRGSGINILGYVASKSALSGWIDACPLVCQ
jgi:hypothetical protein